MSKSGVTCHVLDTVSGRPAAGVRVRLERRDAARGNIDYAIAHCCGGNRRGAVGVLPDDAASGGFHGVIATYTATL